MAAENATKPFGGHGSGPDPAGGAYSAPQTPSSDLRPVSEMTYTLASGTLNSAIRTDGNRPPSGWGWGWLPYSLRTPHSPLSALRAALVLFPHYTVSSDAAGLGPCFFCPSVPHFVHGGDAPARSTCSPSRKRT